MRVLLTGLDLEQLEHRGIAVYTNNLIRALDELGHEVWLLSQHPGLAGQRRLRKSLGINAVSLLARTTLMEALDVGGVREDLLSATSKRDKIANIFIGFAGRIFQKMSRSERHIMNIYHNLFPKRRYHLRARDMYPLPSYPDSPYSYIQRLGYLKHLAGIVSARNIYVNSMRLQARGRREIVTISSGQFDLFLTTCPLGMAAKGIPAVQTIHDTIPIELFKHPDDPILFAHRLTNAGSNLLFVSAESKRRYDFIYERQSARSSDTVIYQPPSLYASLFRAEGEEVNLKLSSLADLQLPNDLAPLRYILFNSKVEYRKNVEFLVQAYLASSLRYDGISLVICGGLEPDRLTSELRQLTEPYEKIPSSKSKLTRSYADSHNDGRILFTGYVDDSIRDSLFTAAMAVVSPSIIEGFGIPVLDAAAMGVPVVASDIGSHQEIRDMYDFKNYVHLASIRSLSAWKQTLNDISLQRKSAVSRAVQQNLLDRAEINMRLKRFIRVRRQIWGSFKDGLAESLEKATTSAP